MILLGACVAAMPAFGQTAAIRNTFGEVGLLDMPSAHMANDGELAFNAGFIGKIQRYSTSLQLTPWLETDFRYSDTQAYGRVEWDRSFMFKLRLVKESDDLPDVSVGIRDLLGTGVYSSEYLAASKHIGPFDLTGGLGWGRLADRGAIPNPLGYIFSSFNVRSTKTTPTAGTVNFKQFFHGPRAGLFGGVAWQTPIENLTLLVEYSSDKYKAEANGRNGYHVRSPLNVGVSYQPTSSIGLSAGWFYGNMYGLRVTLRGDATTTYPSSMRIGPEVMPPAVRSDVEQQKALAAMHAGNARVADAKKGGLWVRVPTAAERARQDLLQAYLSEARGVRDVEISGRSLMVDARADGDGRAQCASYARLAMASDAHLTTLAMTDTQSPGGVVTFCPIPMNAVAETEEGGAPAEATEQRAALERQINADMLRQSLQLDGLAIGTSEIWIYFENYRYDSEAQAIGRVIRVLMADAPPAVEVFHITSVVMGVPMRETTVPRSAIERAVVNAMSTAGISNSISIKPAPLTTPALYHRTEGLYPLFTWSVDPKITEHVFDPDMPLQFMLYGDAAGLAQIAPGLMLAAELTGQIWTNYTFTRSAGSALPHVRTDLLQYLKYGKYGISNLEMVYDTRLAPDVFTEIKAGYLEDMFMGGGGQILWRPQPSRIAIGADVYQVWQRDYNRLFGHRAYDILTGHVSVYYDSPWYGLNFAAHAGRYLAGDYGGTFEVTRRFASGIEIGAWATFTNVPFNKFGEGSFDKGIIIHIPLQWGLPIFSQSAYDLHLHSLTRDGGQRLAGDDSLYAMTRRPSYGDIVGHLNDIVEP